MVLWSVTCLGLNPGSTTYHLCHLARSLYLLGSMESSVKEFSVRAMCLASGMPFISPFLCYSEVEREVSMIEWSWVLEMQTEGSWECHLCHCGHRWRLFISNTPGLSAWTVHIHCSCNLRAASLPR